MLVLWFAIGVGLLATTLGILVLVRSPRHPAHLTYALGMAVIGLEVALAAAGLPSVSGADALEWQRMRLLVATLVSAPWVAFSRLYSRGDYRDALRQHRRGWTVLALLPFAIAVWFRDSLVARVMVPGSDHPVERLLLVGVAITVMTLLTSVAVLTQVERTFRDSVGVMRWRIKYMVLGLSAFFGFRLYASSQALLFDSPGELIGRTGGAALLVACGLMCIALARDRVFSVDVYPSQSLVYRSVAIVLTGLYLLIVGLLSKVIGWFGNPGGLPLQALVILLALAGLSAVLLSERSRLGLREFVNRHLSRPTYDYRQVWRTFTAGTASLVEPEAYCRAVVNWLSGTFQTLSSSIWLLDDTGDRLRLGGSTALVDPAAHQIELSGKDLREALVALMRIRGPVILESGEYPWAESLARLYPGAFPHGGRRVGLPLESAGRTLGLITLGDRVRGRPFTPEDLELLKCVGDQVSSGLLGLRLSGQLLRAKEMEAFQTMSAFFVHDLKNTASTLSLTLQNLHQHFGNPAFRDDALRAVQKSVQHLNGLIARLGRLRQELRVQPAAANLVEVVRSALTAVGPMPSLRFEPENGLTVPVLVDAEQFEKVIVNLVLNAREAVAADGEVQVHVTREGPWGVVKIIDNGVGMTEAFVRDSLFRPFQTTKNNGLGIGMFHSKMIVDAHSGRIDVTSMPGKGTTMRVLLPVHAP